eukprot:1667818-Prymnesium_polylepis.2
MNVFPDAWAGHSYMHIGQEPRMSASLETSDTDMRLQRLGNRSFFGLHCVLYSPQGRAAIAALLNGSRADMQLDAAISALSVLGKLDILVVNHPAEMPLTAFQKPS